MGFYISRTFTKPIDALAGYMAKVAEGNFNLKMEIDSKDEFGILANSFNNMIDKVRELLLKMNEAIGALKGYSNNLDESSRTTADTLEQTSWL